MSNLSQKERMGRPLSDFAGPNRTYPILDNDDVESAAHLIGKAKDPAAVKRAIIQIARRKGLKLPAAWQSDHMQSGKAAIGEALRRTTH